MLKNFKKYIDFLLMRMYNVNTLAKYFINGGCTMDYSVFFDFIKIIVVSILQSVGVFDELAKEGLDVNALLEKLGMEPIKPAEPQA